MVILLTAMDVLQPERLSQDLPALQQEATARPYVGIPSFWGPKSVMMGITSLLMDAHQLVQSKLATIALEYPQSAHPSAGIPLFWVQSHVMMATSLMEMGVPRFAQLKPVSTALLGIALPFVEIPWF